MGAGSKRSWHALAAALLLVTLGGTLAIASEPLLTIVAFQFVPLLLIVALVSTYFYRKTGHIHVGGFVCALFVTWYIVAGQAIHVAG